LVCLPYVQCELIVYLEGYVDGCWMNVLTILCMASV
jgi:hypothetical protein